MRSGLAFCAAALSGCTAGLCSAVVWIMLNLPSRIMHIFGVRSAKQCGWALFIGLTLGSFAPLAGVSAHLGHVFGIAAMLMGGMMTGMLASALAEVANVVPRILYGCNLARSVHPVCWAMALGKAAGAFAATYRVLW